MKDKNVLVICDRGNLFYLYNSFLGAMDPSAYIDKDGWERILHECHLEQFELRENYNQVS